MSTNTDKPYFPEFEGLNTSTSAAHTDKLFFHIRFEHLATAAEVFGDFAAAAVGLIGAYRLCITFLDWGEILSTRTPGFLRQYWSSRSYSLFCLIGKASTARVRECCG